MGKKGTLSWPAYLAIIGLGMLFGGFFGYTAGYVKADGLRNDDVYVTVDFFDSFGRKVTSEYRATPGAIDPIPQSATRIEVSSQRGVITE